MNTRAKTILTLSGIVVIGILWSAFGRPAITPGPTLAPGEHIKVSSPEPQALVSSPLVIEGEARGSWYFEARFPIKLLDGQGKEIATTVVHAKGEWITQDFLPFSVNLDFSSPETDTGTLILNNSNPSGLPENSMELRVPVRFR